VESVVTMKIKIKFGDLAVISALILTTIVLVDVIIKELEPISVTSRFVIIGGIIVTIYLVVIITLQGIHFIRHLPKNL